jgi:hypothetical protein
MWSTHLSLIGLSLRKDHYKLFKNIVKEFFNNLKVRIIRANHVLNSLRPHQKEA